MAPFPIHLAPLGGSRYVYLYISKVVVPLVPHEDLCSRSFRVSGPWGWIASALRLYDNTVWKMLPGSFTPLEPRYMTFFFPLIFDPKQMGGFYESIKSWARWFHGGKPELWIENWYGAQLNCRNAWQQLPEWLDVAIFSRSIILHAIPQLVVNCWFGARWFGYRIPLWKGFLRVSIESQTTGPQTDNYITTI